MKKLTAFVLALTLAFGLAACKKSDPTPSGGGGTGDEVKSYKFGIIYTANNAFWDKVGDGGLAKAAEYNESGKYKIEIYASGPQTTGAAGQIQLMEDMISQGYDGIIISCADTSALQPSIDAAVEAGIPVVCMDTEVPDSKRLCFVGTDNYNFGVAVAEELAKLCDYKGGVLVQYMDPAMLAMAERASGFRDTIGKYPDMNIIFEQADAGGDMTAIAANLETMVAKYEKEFVGYAMLYAAGEQAVNVWRQYGWTCEDKVCVLSDDIPTIIAGVKEGIANCSLVQDQFKWGYEGVRVLVEYLDEGIEPPAFVETKGYACYIEEANKNYPEVEVN